jgi:hypothetical protein
VSQRQAEALVERTSATALNTPSDATVRDAANAKRTAYQVRANMTLLLFGTSSCLAMVVAGVFKALLLKTIGVAGVVVWVDVENAALDLIDRLTVWGGSIRRSKEPRLLVFENQAVVERVNVASRNVVLVPRRNRQPHGCGRLLEDPSGFPTEVSLGSALLSDPPQLARDRGSLSGGQLV